MPRKFGRLPFFSRLVAADHVSGGQPALERPPIDPDVAPVGPLVLLPSMIYHQVLFDSTEMTPAWLKSRPGPNHEPARPTTSVAAERVPKSATPTPKATRQKKAAVNPAEPKPVPTRRPREPRSGRRTSK